MQALKQQEFFINLLHEENRNSSVTRLTRLDGAARQKTYFSLDMIPNITGKSDEYITVNRFTGTDRKAGSIRELSCLYFDFDLHEEYPDGELSHAIENTIHLLFVQHGSKFPIPTCIVETGRGIGVYYVLENSIPCANKRNIKSVEYFKSTYILLQKRFENVLGQYESVDYFGMPQFLELDTTSINDFSRVVRIPGTYNTKAGKYAKLRQATEYPKHTLKEINEGYFKEERAALKRKRAQARKNYTSQAADKSSTVTGLEESMFNRLRMSQLELLQQKRGYDCLGKRELMCFVYYNAAKQVYGESKAFYKLLEYNGLFSQGLQDKELENLKKGIDQNRGIKGDYQGFYKITNRWIIEKLEITEQEKEFIKMSATGSKEMKRQQEKENNRKAREERNKQILSIIQAGNTYKQAAEKTGVSISTVKRVVSENQEEKTTVEPWKEKGISKSTYYRRKQSMGVTVTLGSRDDDVSMTLVEESKEQAGTEMPIGGDNGCNAAETILNTTEFPALYKNINRKHTLGKKFSWG